MDDQVAGDAEPLGPILPNGLLRIPPYAGQGTFGAGVAKCGAPGRGVCQQSLHGVRGRSGGCDIQKLNQLITTQNPDVVCLPAGLYARNDWEPLPFSQLHQMHPNITLVASAGNDSTDRKFYPRPSIG